MPSISGDTKIFGLLGQGTSFTLSPAMHNHAAKVLQQDAVYLNFDIPADQVKPFLEVFWHLGAIGLNVTMPHKNLVASLVETDGLPSVNTLVRTEKGWKGYSTDGDGFLEGLSRANVSITEFDAVVVLGSGGSCQSILRAISLATTQKPLVTIIHRRSRSNDSKILEAISKAQVQLVTLREMSPSAFSDTLANLSGLRKLVIQVTSAPKLGDSLAAYTPAVKNLSAGDLLVDIIYDHPSEIYFEAIRQNINCLDGMPMLIEQARLSQFLWWKKAASYNDLIIAVKNSGWRSR